MTYLNEKHNEAARIEDSLSTASSVLTDLSNELYAKDPEHPLLAELSSVINTVGDIDFEAPYKEAQAAAGDSWWEKAPA